MRSVTSAIELTETTTVAGVLRIECPEGATEILGERWQPVLEFKDKRRVGAYRAGADHGGRPAAHQFRQVRRRDVTRG